MIKLFKKIRQDLLEKKQLNKYLMYAFGEVILVMVGILLALFISNWNSNQKEIEKEHWYLINIVEDLEYQKVILSDMKDFNTETIQICKSILKDYNQHKGFIKIDSLNQRLNSLLLSYNFPNINNTYTELISSGQFGLIKDKALSIDIINYYLNCEESAANTNSDIVNIFYPEIATVINKFSQVELFDEDVKEGEEYLLEIDKNLTKHIHNLLNKTTTELALTNAIKTKILIQSGHLITVEEALKLNDTLIKSIDKYLGLTPDMVNNVN